MNRLSTENIVSSIWRHAYRELACRSPTARAHWKSAVTDIILDDVPSWMRPGIDRLLESTASIRGEVNGWLPITMIRDIAIQYVRAMSVEQEQP